MIAASSRTRRWVVLCVVGVLLAACGCGQPAGGDDVLDDSEPPVAVTDLTATDITTSSVTLTWTAPHRTSTHQPADSYDIRWSTAPITEATWGAATAIDDEPLPAPGGWAQTLVVDDLMGGSTCYFALKSIDASARTSPLSNQASATLVVDATVAFADPQLEAAVREAIQLPTGPIHRSDCFAVRSLAASGRAIANLAGLEECRFLEALDLSGNSISQLSALGGLTKLRSLHISGNPLDDLGPLAGLLQLDQLLAESDRITALGPLAGLANLHLVVLNGNLVSDIGPLVANAGLGVGDRISLHDNPLSAQAVDVDIPALRARGIEVQWALDDFPPASIVDLRVVETAPTSVTLAWTAPGDDGMSGSAFGYEVRYATDATTVSGWTGATPATGAPLPEPAATVQQMEVTGLSTDVTYHLAIKSRDEASNWSPLSNVVRATPFVDRVVTFPDANLEAALRDALEKPAGDIHRSELTLLQNLQAPRRGITNLAGLEHCQNLRVLNLQENAIASIANLADLIYLTDLNLRGNALTDVSPVAGLTDLNLLDLGANQLTSIAPLGSLTRVQVLILGVNSIVDVGPLASLTQLMHLDLTRNAVQDVTALAGLDRLQTLFLGTNQIEDIAPLAGLVRLRNCYLDANRLADLNPARGLTALEKFFVRFNQIADIHPLVDNPGVAAGDEVGLAGNPLSQQAIDVDIPTLQARGVTVTR